MDDPARSLEISVWKSVFKANLSVHS
jgi:hypothetical protein